MYWVVASPPKGETSDLTAQLGGRALVMIHHLQVVLHARQLLANFDICAVRL